MEKTHSIRLFMSILFVAVCFVVNSCSVKNENEVEWHFSRSISRDFQSNGWCYSFVHEYNKSKEYVTKGDIHYSFYAINLRYSYSAEYIMSERRETKEITYIERYAPGVLIWGNGSQKQKHDMELIQNKILLQDRSVDELLALDPADYAFQELDKELFFRLMRESLTGEACKETTKQLYADKPTFAMLCEPEYIDGYKFQVAFVVGMGYIEEIYIDVRYQTGPEYDGFVQLSDLIDHGEAEEKQKEAFTFIQSLCSSVRGTDDLLIRSEEYQNLSIGDLDFSRLYAFMNAIHLNQYTSYIESPVIISLEEIAE